MPNPNDLLKMPVKVQPYEHQKRAFAFAMRMFGVFEEGGDDLANDDDYLRFMRKEVQKAVNRSQ